jgi:hypothetical protein
MSCPSRSAGILPAFFVIVPSFLFRFGCVEFLVEKPG